MSMTSPRLSFIVEHYDTLAQMVKKYQLFYYPEDASIEMYDIKNLRIFLKRIVNPEVKTSSLYIGSEISIYSRQYKIIAFADEYTKKTLENVRTSVFALILPSAYMIIGKIIDIIQTNGFIINKLKMNKLSNKEASNYLKIHNSNEISPEFLSSDFVVGMELVKSNAVAEIDKLVKNEINNLTKENNPIIIYSNDLNIAQQEINYYFNIKHQPQLSNCSLLVIKPHIIESGNAGKLIDIILNEGFEISSMTMIYLDKETAENFFDVYKEFLPEYSAIINHLISGPIIALELREDDVVHKLRALVGPHDPVIAKALRPHTFRALFGIDRVRNVCHCTDLPEDGVLECQYFFELV
jgi:nucleoside-diphosphate kinase